MLIVDFPFHCALCIVGLRRRVPPPAATVSGTETGVNLVAPIIGVLVKLVKLYASLAQPVVNALVNSVDLLLVDLCDLALGLLQFFIRRLDRA